MISALKRCVPWRLKKLWWDKVRSESLVSYERLYEDHARAYEADDAVGSGDYETIGRIEFDLLSMEGLKASDTLVDFGCGTGRLAVHAAPALSSGSYIGLDVSQTFLDRADRQMKRLVPQPSCTIKWLKQMGTYFSLEDRSVDVICAFSVFTHMEHEDTYRYLKDARRIIRPGGRFVFSCLPMNLSCAKDIFIDSAKKDIGERWSTVRNVTTSTDLMDEISRLAGWRPVRWYAGDENNIGCGEGPKRGLGQSSCVLLAT